MSAFVVENTVISRVVTLIATARDLDDIRSMVLAETGLDLSTQEGRQELGEAMLRLNCQGVDARYGKGESQSFRDDLEYTFRLEQSTILQAYKSLQCWHYQCCEGDIPESSLLYATMGRVADMLAHEIVRHMPAYNKAAW